jgi:hypothetical protein
MTPGLRESNGASEFVPNTDSNFSKAKCRWPGAVPRLPESNLVKLCYAKIPSGYHLI